MKKLLSFFGFLKKKNSQVDDSTLKEFSFIWYKRLETDAKVVYTQPFRTKVKAKNHDEARKKMEEFALRKMQLVILSEGEDKSESDSLLKMQSDFDKLYNQMNDFHERARKY